MGSTTTSTAAEPAASKRQQQEKQEPASPVTLSSLLTATTCGTPASTKALPLSSEEHELMNTSSVRTPPARNRFFRGFTCGSSEPLHEFSFSDHGLQNAPRALENVIMSEHQPTKARWTRDTNRTPADILKVKHSPQARPFLSTIVQYNPSTPGCVLLTLGRRNSMFARSLYPTSSKRLSNHRNKHGRREPNHMQSSISLCCSYLLRSTCCVYSLTDRINLRGRHSLRRTWRGSMIPQDLSWLDSNARNSLLPWPV